MKTAITITNRSRYDDIAVDILVNFALESVTRVWSIPRDKLRVKVTNTCNGWHGYAYINGQGTDAGGFHVCIRIGSPKYFSTPKRISYDHKWRDMPEMFLNDWRECMVYIAAHEFGHSAGRSGRKNGEMGTEFAGQDAVDEYRKCRAEIDGKIDSRIAAKVQRETAVVERRTSKVAFAKSAAGRLQKAERMLAQWERKAKLARTKIKSYRRSVGALHRSIEKQAAAKTIPLELNLAKAAASQ